LGVPQAHCRASDRGFVHAARAHNLRWRLVHHSGTEAAPKPSELPPSLRLLVEDFKGDAATIALRPLSPRALKAGLRRSQRPAPDDEDTSMSSPPLRAAVSFRTDTLLIAEVPVLLGQSARLERTCTRCPTPRLRGESPGKACGPRRTLSEREALKRANLQRVWANHRRVVKSAAMPGCLVFLRSWLRRNIAPALLRTAAPGAGTSGVCAKARTPGSSPDLAAASQ